MERTLIYIVAIALMIAMFLSGCAMKTTTVYKEGIEVMRFEHSSDAVVTYKDKDVESSVDERGNKGMFESATEYLMMKGIEEGD